MFLEEIQYSFVLLFYILFYPLIYFVCAWNGVGKYIRITAINLEEDNISTFISYKLGFKSGYNEFINCHKRIFNKLIKRLNL